MHNIRLMNNVVGSNNNDASKTKVGVKDLFVINHLCKMSIERKFIKAAGPKHYLHKLKTETPLLHLEKVNPSYQRIAVKGQTRRCSRMICTFFLHLLVLALLVLHQLRASWLQQVHQHLGANGNI